MEELLRQRERLLQERTAGGLTSPVDSVDRVGLMGALCCARPAQALEQQAEEHSREAGVFHPTGPTCLRCALACSGMPWHVGSIAGSSAEPCSQEVPSSYAEWEGTQAYLLQSFYQTGYVALQAPSDWLLKQALLSMNADDGHMA